MAPETEISELTFKEIFQQQKVKYYTKLLQKDAKHPYTFTATHTFAYASNIIIC
jgi:hypothetical protein